MQQSTGSMPMNSDDYVKISPCEKKAPFRHTVLLSEFVLRYAQQPLVSRYTALFPCNLI